jgi:hypothetical protein
MLMPWFLPSGRDVARVTALMIARAALTAAHVALDTGLVLIEVALGDDR